MNHPKSENECIRSCLKKFQSRSYQTCSVRECLSSSVLINLVLYTHKNKYNKFRNIIFLIFAFIRSCREMNNI